MKKSTDFLFSSLSSKIKVFKNLSFLVVLLLLLSGGTWGQTLINENFEGATFPPTGWVVTNAGTGNNWGRSTATSYPAQYAGSTAYMLYTYNSSNAANTWAFSPGVSLTAGTEYYLEFQQAATTYAENLKVTLGQGQTVAAQTTTLLTLSSVVNTTYIKRTVAFIAPTTGTYNIAFNCFSVANMNTIAVDEIKLRVPLTTGNAAPISFSATTVTATSMTVNWVDNSTNETSFNVYRSGDGGASYTLIGNVSSTSTAGTGTAYSLAQTGLSPGITYLYKIGAAIEGSGTFLNGSKATTAAATYYYVGAATGSDFSTPASWNANPAGGGTTRTTALTTDILIIDGVGTTNTAGSITIAMAAAQSIGALQITNNTST
jgi:hypothetical protein